jgi:uncharacterized protein
MNDVRRKTFPADLKAGDAGKVEALVSVFGNVDLAGEKVMPGAFAGTIAKWKADGRPVPVVFSHKWDDPWAHIGVVDDLEETADGLKASYTLDVADNPLAAHIHRLMGRGSLKEHSFAYSVNKERRGTDGSVELHDLDLIEVGPTLKGMNPDTELLAVKSAAEAASGRTMSAGEVAEAAFDAAVVHMLPADAVSRLKSAVDAINDVLSSAVADDPGKKAETESAKPDGEGGPGVDPDLVAIQRQLSELRL